MGRTAIVGALLAGCGGGASAVPTGERVGPAITAALAAAEHQRTPWRCAAPDGPNLVDEVIDGWTLAAHTMTKPGDGGVTIAAIADAGGASPATIASLGRMKTRLAKVDLVIALGGMGTTQGELEATLGALADKASYAVVALPGDLESAGALAAAIAAMRTKGQLVIDGRLAQRIELHGVTIATIPGGGAADRLVAGGDGCAYRAEDVTPALADLTMRKGLRILATSEAPRITLDGEAAGEIALTPGTGTEVDVVLHGPLTAAPTKAISGAREAGAIALSPGTADATSRLPGPVRAPSAGILTIRGDAWSWKPVADAE